MAPSTSAYSLGTRCLALDRAVIVLDNQLVPLPQPLEPVRHPYGPAVGIRCAPATTAIAYPIAARLVHDNPAGQRLAVVVRRSGTFQIVDSHHIIDSEHIVDSEHIINSHHIVDSDHVVDSKRCAPMSVSDAWGPVIDVGRRALGLATPPESTPPVVMLDAIWIDRVLGASLAADLGRPPPWDRLVALHPLAGTTLAPWMLRDRRLALSFDWSAFRHRATGVDTAWPDLPPSLAGWLDDGSFARWVLADLPSTRLLLDDLAELLEPPVMADIDEALAGAPLW